MKILFTISGLERTSGVSCFCMEIAGCLSRLGHDVYVLCPRLIEYPIPHGVTFIEGGSIQQVPVRPDVVHVHAVWSWFSVSAMRWCVKEHVPFVVSPHGCLMDRVFKKNRLRKLLFYKVFVKPLMARAHAIHCTGDGERATVIRLGFSVPVVMAPLGCNLPSDYSELREKTVLFIGRISEEKGLLLLLRAWKRLRLTDWRLVIAGPDWQGYQSQLDQFVSREGVVGVCFPGAADEEVKDRLYRSAGVFVLPSPTENFSAVVLDALAYGVPVICTKGTPWHIIQERQCGWWIEPNSEHALYIALQEATGLSIGRRISMGGRARDIARGYEWMEIAKQVVKTYK